VKRALLACLLLVLGVCESAAAQDRPGSAPRDTLPWNEADFGWTTFRFGAGLLVDYAAFAQDDDSKEQVRLNPGFKLRDARVLFRGRFRGRRGITWQTGIMYDEPTNTLRFRQTGFMFPLDGDWGRIFIGRKSR
jgi:phosphate-selective porin OprO/OprP